MDTGDMHIFTPKHNDKAAGAGGGGLKMLVLWVLTKVSE